jgi:hypothetical protein
VAEHISRKELKQDKIRESFEHGAEAVYSHSTVAGIVVAIVLVVAVGYAGWKFYSDRQTLQASVALDDAMKTECRPGRHIFSHGRSSCQRQPAKIHCRCRQVSSHISWSPCPLLSGADA